MLRSELDQRGQITDVGKPVMRQDDGAFAFVEEQKEKESCQVPGSEAAGPELDVAD
jgi:hypothetical protein